MNNPNKNCPVCGWPEGQGCDLCGQHDTRTYPAFPADVAETVRKLQINGEELRALGEQLMADKQPTTIRSLIYLRAHKLWGTNAQMRQLQEEAAEVIVAVNHAIRGSDTEGSYTPEHSVNLAMEMADLEIMLEQMRAMGWARLIDHHKALKLERLKSRVEEAEEKNR